MTGDGSANLAKVAVGRRQGAGKDDLFCPIPAARPRHLPPATCHLLPGIRIASGGDMAITGQQKRMLALGAMGAGVVLAAQMWRRRDPYEFAGRSVVITGGSRGLGLVMARQLADQGARLTLVARDEEELHRAVDDLQGRQP